MKGTNDDPDAFPLPEGAAAAALLGLGFRTAESGQRTAGEGRDGGPGDHIGPYRLAALLGEGGFGAVWRVEQTRPIRRELALKLIRRGMDSREIIARFEAERQALALMDHPNIAAVVDAGAAENGRPWFAMELVRGEPLTVWCDSRRLDVRGRVELFISVCHAVQHAHQKAILHRDLKPSNILVTEVDGRAVPKVIDFGIAKAIGLPHDTTGGGGPASTRDGGVMGTPQYMSPEQAGSVPDVDMRSDIYSLGVILYELLTGGSPLEMPHPAPPFDEILRRVRTEEAPRPSSRVSDAAGGSGETAAALRGTDTARLRRRLRGDLDWIVIKALEKDRRRRYDTASALAADLLRHLRREPVSAAAPGWRYRFSKFACRHRAGFAAAGIAVLSLVAGTAVSVWQAAEAGKAEAEAVRSGQLAEANYRRAREAVEQYLSRVTENPRLNTGDFSSLRKELLETALPFYEQLISTAGPDKDFRADQAWALGRLAHLYSGTGEKEKAEQTFRRAIALGELAVKDSPERVDFRAGLSLFCQNMGSLLRDRGRNAEAETVQRRALELAERLVAEEPANGEFRHGLMAILLNLVHTVNDGGKRREEAEALVARAMEAGEKLVRDVPGEPLYRGQLAACRGALAGLHAQAGRVEAADQAFRGARGIQEKLVEEFPLDPEYRGSGAVTSYNHGFLLVNNGRAAEGVMILRRGVDAFRALTADFPSVPFYRHEMMKALEFLGGALTDLRRGGEAEAVFFEAADMLRGFQRESPGEDGYWHREGLIMRKLASLKRAEGRWTEAVGLYRQGIACHRRALEMRPEHPAYRESLCALLQRLADACVHADDIPGAVEAAEALAGERPQGWAACEATAAAMARAVARMETPGAASPELGGRCAAAAVELLRRGGCFDYPGMAAVKADAKFAALRSFPEFPALEEPPPDPVDRCPARFTFDYPHDDPGKRVWRRDGRVWREVQPSGKTNCFDTGGRIRVRGISGTEITGRADNRIRFFIPDLATGASPRLMISQAGGEWSFVGILTDME